mgnify:CR=1 FL=1
MNEFKEGDVVIVPTTQAGTLTQISGKEIWTLLANNDIWTGSLHQIRHPQDEADLKACPLNIERLEHKSFISSK